MKKIAILAPAVLMVLLTCSPSFAEDEAPRSRLSAWAERISISGALEADMSWIDPKDNGDKHSGTQSDLFMSTVELGIEAKVAEWITAEVVLLREDLGKQDDEGEIEIDEAKIVFQDEDVPFYAIVGQQYVPFGVFGSHLVNDPMTQDAYETGDTALRVGVTGPMDLDFSVSIYQGPSMMDHLFESELFAVSDTEGVERTDQDKDSTINSYVFAVSVSPIEDHLTLSAAYMADSGFSDNTSFQVGIDYACVFFEGLMLDVEYMGALERNDYLVNGSTTREYKESVFTASLSYELGSGKEDETEGSHYIARHPRLFPAPAGVSLRYETFDDDGMAEDTDTWSVRNRWSVGGWYKFFEDEELGVAATFSAEYRQTSYRDESPEAASHANEFVARLGVNF